MYFDRFDIVEAHYLFCLDYYNGQTCPLYARLCKLIIKYKFVPNLSIREYGIKGLSKNGKSIYKNLVRKFRKKNARPKPN